MAEYPPVGLVGESGVCNNKIKFSKYTEKYKIKEKILELEK